MSTPIETSLGVGTVVGAAEVFTTHPLWVAKTRKQCGYPFTWDVRVLYRGALTEAITMVPVDAIQMLISTLLNERVLDNSDNTSQQKRFAAGFVGGAIGGVFINGIESVMTLQQKYALRFSKLSQALIQAGNVRQLLVGSVETALRNGIYNSGFFALTPRVYKFVKEYIPQNQVAVVVSGVMSGIVVSMISHPLDVIKTKRQVAESARQSICHTIASIYSQHGASGFFIGLFARTSRVMLGISMMGLVYHSIENNHTVF